MNKIAAQIDMAIEKIISDECSQIFNMKFIIAMANTFE